MVITIMVMIFFDVMHPPAVSTSLNFASRAENEINFVLCGLAVLPVTILVVLERAALWLLAFYKYESKENS